LLLHHGCGNPDCSHNKGLHQCVWASPLDGIRLIVDTLHVLKSIEKAMRDTQPDIHEESERIGYIPYKFKVRDLVSYSEEPHT